MSSRNVQSRQSYMSLRLARSATYNTQLRMWQGGKKSQREKIKIAFKVESSSQSPISVFLLPHVFTLWYLMLHPFHFHKGNGNQQLVKLALCTPSFATCGVSIGKDSKAAQSSLPRYSTLIFPHCLVPSHIDYASHSAQKRETVCLYTISRDIKGSRSCNIIDSTTTRDTILRTVTLAV